MAGLGLRRTKQQIYGMKQCTNFVYYLSLTNSTALKKNISQWQHHQWGAQLYKINSFKISSFKDPIWRCGSFFSPFIHYNPFIDTSTQPLWNIIITGKRKRDTVLKCLHVNNHANESIHSNVLKYNAVYQGHGLCDQCEHASYKQNLLWFIIVSKSPGSKKLNLLDGWMSVTQQLYGNQYEAS